MTKVTQKVFHVFLSLHLCLIICGMSARPDVSFCGEACAHFLYDEPRENTQPYHKRCHRSDCKTCNAEKGTGLDLQAARTADYSKKGCDFAHITIAPTDDLLSDYAFSQFDSIYSITGCDPPPIYLQNCSFLC